MKYTFDKGIFSTAAKEVITSTCQNLCPLMTIMTMAMMAMMIVVTKMMMKMILAMARNPSMKIEAAKQVKAARAV